MEFIVTSLLLFVVVSTAVDRACKAPKLAPIPIGFALAAGVSIAGTFTGGSLNTARTFGPAVVGGDWRAQWIYWCAHFGGAIIVGLVYRFVFLTGPLPEDRPRDLRTVKTWASPSIQPENHLPADLHAVAHGASVGLA